MLDFRVKSYENFKKHVTSMSWHMGPRYGRVTLVSGYAILAAFN